MQQHSTEEREARPGPAQGRRAEPWEALGWERPSDDTPSAPAQESPARYAKERERDLPDAVATEITQTVGGRRGVKVGAAVAEAAEAYERERFADAVRILKPVIDEAPDLASARELLGLSLYRQDKWTEALRHLTRFAELTGSSEQNPVMADCHRALRHYDTVTALWEELAASSPGAELVAEGRIVMAGALADQGRLDDAIKLLERAPGGTKRPRQHHLRLWYALADLYERAGEVPRARDLFTKVLSAEPTFGDVADRVAALG